MIRLFPSVLVVALGFSVIAVQAMPFSGNQNRGTLVVPVADGCGFNKYRDAATQARGAVHYPALPFADVGPGHRGRDLSPL